METNYIRGIEDKGREVINLLLSMGGKNELCLEGGLSYCFYYIDSDNVIQLIDEFNEKITEQWTEIFLPTPLHMNNVYSYKGNEYTLLEVIKGKFETVWQEFVIYTDKDNNKYTRPKCIFDKLFIKKVN